MNFFKSFLVLIYSLSYIFTAEASFVLDKYDTLGNKTLRAIRTVDDDDFIDELNKIDKNIIKCVNLVDQGRITDKILSNLLSLTNLEFLNVENTGITKNGIDSFLDQRSRAGNPMENKLNSFILKKETSN